MSSPLATDSMTQARFVTGSTFLHVLKMTLASAIGLTAIFSVDLLNVFYINLLGDPIITAALGFASTILLFQVSIGIGLSIGASVLVSRQIGAKQTDQATLSATSALFVTLGLGTLIVLLGFPFIEHMLYAIGARGSTIDHATRYLIYVFPSMPLFIFGMTCSGIVRGIGDAKGAMWVTLSGALFIMVADPILIIWLDLGLEGAAVAALASRIIVFFVGIYLVKIKHRMVNTSSLKAIIQRSKELIFLSLPIILTNLATAVGFSLLTRFVAEFGAHANAANTSIGRLVPFIFGFLFALSGAVGPVIGQNFGAKRYDRMIKAYIDGIVIALCYTVLIIVINLIFANSISSLLGLKGSVADLASYFLRYATWPYLFFGLLIVSNAVFNTLGKPHFATLFNWTRATLGVIPFCYIGAQYGGVEGVILGHSLGFIPFGIAATVFAFYFIKTIIAEDSKHTG